MSRKKIFRGGSSLQAGNVPIIASIIVLISFIAGLMIGSLIAVRAYSDSDYGACQEDISAKTRFNTGRVEVMKAPVSPESQSGEPVEPESIK